MANDTLNGIRYGFPVLEQLMADAVHKFGAQEHKVNCH